ncbi:hypothetical protein [Microcoleus sp. PH2017_02_FOX_O_A]|nr:hypothetical protein [Microcoleus sp. PH2017_02_FOX_O_A]
MDAKTRFDGGKDCVSVLVAGQKTVAQSSGASALDLNFSSIPAVPVVQTK